MSASAFAEWNKVICWVPRDRIYRQFHFTTTVSFCWSSSLVTLCSLFTHFRSSRSVTSYSKASSHCISTSGTTEVEVVKHLPQLSVNEWNQSQRGSKGSNVCAIATHTSGQQWAADQGRLTEKESRPRVLCVQGRWCDRWCAHDDDDAAVELKTSVREERGLLFHHHHHHHHDHWLTHLNTTDHPSVRAVFRCLWQAIKAVLFIYSNGQHKTTIARVLFLFFSILFSPFHRTKNTTYHRL